MATIPLGNFGNVMPQAQAGRVIDTGAAHIGNAVNTLGQTGQKIAVKELTEQKKIQDEKDEYFFNTQAAKYGSDYTDIVTDTKQRLVTGEFDETSAKTHLREQSDKLAETYRQTLPDTKHPKFDYYAEKMFLESETNVKPLAYETERKKINADFEQVGEATLKFENREQAFALYKDTIDRNPVLTPEQRVIAEQKWQERRDLSDAKSIIGALETAQDSDTLKQLHDNMDSTFQYMKVETRDVLKNNISSSIDRINKGLKIEQEKALKVAKQVATDYRTDVYTGLPISASKTEEVLEAVKGTEYEAQVREDLALSKDAQSFRNLSPVEQERSISRIRSEIERTPQDDASLLQKKLNLYQGIANASKDRAKNDPIAAIQSQTGKQLITVKPEEIGLGKADFKQAQITTQLLADQKQANGGVGSLVQWSTTEKQVFKDKYYAATPSKQAAMLNDLTKMTGGNKEAQKEYMSLIAGDKSAYEYVGINRLSQLGVRLRGTNIQVAEVALEGKALISNGSAKVLVNEKELKTATGMMFGNTVGAGGIEHSTYQELIHATYAGLAKREGIKTDEKGNPILSKTMANRAFELVTGGVYKQKLGSNTQTVFKPYGMGTDEFADKLEEAVNINYWKETGKRVDRGFLNTHAIEQIPNAYGWYWFRNPDGSRHMNPKTNKAYIINIKK